MGLWSKGIHRSNIGEVRLEDDRTNMIDEFFANQSNIVRYEIVDKQNWVVEAEGSIHLNEADLDDGELFFTIGKLTGNLYCHCKHLKPSVIPQEFGGEIVFVPNEEELWKNRQSKGATAADDDFWGMEAITTKVRSKADIVKSIKVALADLISSNYDEEVNLTELFDDVKEHSSSEEDYSLNLEIKKRASGKIQCDIYLKEDKSVELNLNPIQKAIYLMYVLNEHGVAVDDLMNDDWKVAKQIYGQLYHTAQKTVLRNKKTNEEEKYDLGILDKPFTPSSVRGYISEIRDKLKGLIYFQNIRNEFSIEGKKGEPFKIRKSTAALREQIKQKFELE